MPAERSAYRNSQSDKKPPVQSTQAVPSAQSVHDRPEVAEFELPNEELDWYLTRQAVFDLQGNTFAAFQVLEMVWNEDQSTYGPRVSAEYHCRGARGAAFP